MAEMKLTDGEKLILLMLCEIQEALKIKGGTDTKLIQSAIDKGHLWALKRQLSGVFHDSEPTQEMIDEVVQVMDMWRYIESSHERLSAEDKARIKKEAGPFGDHVKFDGFDSNGEAHYGSIARFFVDDLGEFEIFKGRDLDPRMPRRATYQRMLAVFSPMRLSLAGHDLDTDQLIAALSAAIHPEQRRAAGTIN